MNTINICSICGHTVDVNNPCNFTCKKCGSKVYHAITEQNKSDIWNDDSPLNYYHSVLLEPRVSEIPLIRRFGIIKSKGMFAKKRY